MTQIRVESFTISLDGYGAGPDQDSNNPLGVGGKDLRQWSILTRTFQRTLADRLTVSSSHLTGFGIQKKDGWARLSGSRIHLTWG